MASRVLALALAIGGLLCGQVYKRPGGGSGGPVTSTALQECKVSATATVISISACRAALNSTLFTPAAATATITAGSGSGTAVVKMDVNGSVVVEHPAAAGLTVTCSGCVSSQVATPAVLMGEVGLASVAIASGAWGTVTDTRALLRSAALTAGYGISISSAGLIEVDSADINGLNPGTRADKTYIKERDDFVAGAGTNGAIGKLGWKLGFAGSSAVVAVSPEAGRPGVVQLQTGSTSGNYTAITLAPASGTQNLLTDFSAQTNLALGAAVKFGVSASSVIMRVGYASSAGTSATDYAAVRFIAGTDTNYTLAACAASVCTTADLGVAPGTTWHDIYILKSGAGSVSACVDSCSTVGTVSTNLPTAAVTPTIYVETATTATRNLNVDWAEFSQDLTGAR